MPNTVRSLAPAALTTWSAQAREVATRYGHRAGVDALLAELQRSGEPYITARSG